MMDEANSCEKETSTIIQCPLIGSIQKIVVYETASRFYLVGSNNIETRFKILKIDRMEPKELVIDSDNLEYTRKEIKDLLRMVDLGNRPKNQNNKSGGRNQVGLKRIHSAFGVVGFVRFLEGYYMVLITKRRRVAEIGAHTVYKIEDTTTVYIPSCPSSKNSDEQRYLKMFHNVDLSSNFYFSYSYDLTNSLQHNMIPCRLNSSDLEDIHSQPRVIQTENQSTDARHPPSDPRTSVSSTTKDGGRGGSNVDENCVPKTENNETSVNNLTPTTNSSEAKNGLNSSEAENDVKVEDALNSTFNLLEDDDVDDDDDLSCGQKRNASHDDCAGGKVKKLTHIGVRFPPSQKFVWNEHLLKDIVKILHYDWILYIIHGFIGQSNINVYNKSVFLTLIARRSSKYAGTRFLKRGANSEGFVANEVETEQIIFDGSFTSPERVRFTSFVQIRGSIPLQWSQDGSVMVPKPPINLDQSDPFGAVAGQHFNQLLSRFGSQVIVLDLVKKKEKRPHESLISDEFITSIQYLNQFLPVEHRIKYIGYDMAKLSKKKNMDIFKKLDVIAEYCLQRTGFYQSRPGFYSNQLRPNKKCLDVVASREETGRRQRGVVRTNCIDCLDRTNTAQYAIGKCALAKQLYSLGVLDDLTLDYDSDCIRMMEHMYEDQGDTLALQYGGSQLVHRIKGYRKVAPWTSSSRDIMQTLSRYYSNTFSDSDKQNAINLFLGKFVPSEAEVNVWDLGTDFYLHNRVAVDITSRKKRSYTMWWDPTVLDSLPFAYEDDSKGVGMEKIVIKIHPKDERIDLAFDHYKPFELTTFDELFVFNMASSVRDFMPKSSSNYSPFCARMRPGTKQDPYGNKQEANPNVSGKDSSGSSASTGSEGSLSGSEEDINWGDDKEEVLKILSSIATITSNDDINQTSSSHESPTTVRCIKKLLDDEKEVFKQRYGVSIEKPSSESMNIYTRYASNASLVDNFLNTSSRSRNCHPLYNKIIEPIKSSDDSVYVYKRFVRSATEGPEPPSERSMEVYRAYVDTKKYGLEFRGQRSFPLLTSSHTRGLVTGEDFRGNSG